MGVEISEQLWLLYASFILGLCGALLCDLLRTIRLQLPLRLKWLPDLLSCLLCAAAMFLFILRAANGIFQLFNLFRQTYVGYFLIAEFQVRIIIHFFTFWSLYFLCSGNFPNRNTGKIIFNSTSVGKIRSLQFNL